MAFICTNLPLRAKSCLVSRSTTGKIEMREVMERILEVKRKLDQHDDALDVLASLRLHASDAYQTLQRACFAMCDEVDLLESRLLSLMLVRSV
jgi:hypothetical protein